MMTDRQGSALGCSAWTSTVETWLGFWELTEAGGEVDWAWMLQVTDERQ
jgi:hypothetical protein